MTKYVNIKRFTARALVGLLLALLLVSTGCKKIVAKPAAEDDGTGTAEAKNIHHKYGSCTILQSEFLFEKTEDGKAVITMADVADKADAKKNESAEKLVPFFSPYTLEPFGELDFSKSNYKKAKLKDDGTFEFLNERDEKTEKDAGIRVTMAVINLTLQADKGSDLLETTWLFSGGTLGKGKARMEIASEDFLKLMSSGDDLVVQAVSMKIEKVSEKDEAYQLTMVVNEQRKGDPEVRACRVSAEAEIEVVEPKVEESVADDREAPNPSPTKIRVKIPETQESAPLEISIKVPKPKKEEKKDAETA